MLHFEPEEFDQRMARTREAAKRVWTFCFCCTQPILANWLRHVRILLLPVFSCFRPRACVADAVPDLRQAELTSTIKDIRIWRDQADADPPQDLAKLLKELNLSEKRIGWETKTQGLVHAHGARLAELLPNLMDASDIMGKLRSSRVRKRSLHKKSGVRRCRVDAAVASRARRERKRHPGRHASRNFLRRWRLSPMNSLSAQAITRSCVASGGRRVLDTNDQLNLSGQAHTNTIIRRCFARLSSASRDHNTSPCTPRSERP